VITVKSKGELQLMRDAGKLLAEVLDELEDYCAAGVTTNEIDRQADRLIRQRDCTPGFLASRAAG
jgi:methionyl aminopeptidase